MVRIIHISDFHLESTDPPFRKKRLTEAFFKDINSFVTENTLLAFTGDLITKGGIDFTKKEDAFKDFDSFFLTPLKNKFPKLPIFFIPGNHDCDRSQVDIYQDSGIKKDITSEDLLTAFLKEKGDNEQYFKRLERYKEFEKKNLFTGKSHKFSNLSTSFIIDLNEQSVGVSCLNSSWLCLNDNDKEKLLVGEKQLHDSLEFIKDCEIKIALVHHPLEFLADFDKERIKPILEKYYDILLTGHVHKLDSSFTQNLSGDLFISIANSTIGDYSELRKYTNGYCIIDFYPTEKIIAYYRKYIESVETFVANTDIGNSEGLKVFLFPNLGTAIENKEKSTVEKKQITSDINEQIDDDFYSAVKLLLDKEKNLGTLSGDKEIREYKDLHAKILGVINKGHEKFENIPALTEKFPIELFDIIYSSEALTTDIISDINRIRASDQYKWYHRSLIVSSLTLSIINFKKLDQHKVLLLIDFAKDGEEKVWEKALTGLVVALTYRRNSWLRFSMITQKLKSLKDDIKIQIALKKIGVILEHQLYGLYFNSDNILKVDFYKTPAHCFIPFYEGNKAIEFVYDNIQRSDIERIIKKLSDLPYPDILKYYLCYSGAFDEGEKVDESRKKKLYDFFAYVLSTSSVFAPFLQFLNELYAFVNFYPSEKKQEVFSKQLSLAQTSLKDYLLNEVEKHRTVATHFMVLKDYSLAVSHFNSLIKFKEDDLEALKNLSACLKELEHNNELLEVLLKIEKYDDDLENKIDLANLYERKGEIENALAYLNKTKDIDLKESKLYANRGRIWENLHNSENAFNDLNRAIEIDPKNDHAYLTRGISCVNLKKYNEATLDYNKAIELDPKESRNYCYRGNLYCRLNQYTNAFADYDKAISLDSKNKLAYLFRGTAFRDIKKYNLALIDYNKAIELSPRSAEAFFYRGNFFSHIRKHDLALIDFNKAIELNPFDMRCYLFRGAFYKKIRNYDKTLSDYNKALEIDSKEASLYMFRGEYYRSIKDYKKSLIDLNRAVELKPNDDMTYVYFGNFYLSVNDFDKSFKEFSRAMELNKNNDSQYWGLGLASMRQKKYSKALEYFKNGKKINPYTIYSFNGTATVHRLEGNFAEAFDSINRYKKQFGEILIDDEAGAYYSCVAEIKSSLGDVEGFYLNLDLAFQNGYDISALEVDVLEKHKSESKFISLLEEYKQTL